jgi:hypothetical protein
MPLCKRSEWELIGIGPVFVAFRVQKQTAQTRAIRRTEPYFMLTLSSGLWENERSADGPILTNSALA